MEKIERKSRTSKFRQIEAGIWICVIIIFAIFFVLFFNYYEKTYETHKIYMPDVDGLITGSPVNLMGIPVGYVTKTKIINDEEIIVKFKITDKNVQLQRGTVATVEFSGLGGSKSLELYPPASGKKITKELLVNNNDDYILVERPKRLRDCFTLLFQMYQKVMNIICSVSYFGSELNRIESISVKKSEAEAVNYLDYADKWLDTSSGSMEKFRSILEEKYRGKDCYEKCKNY